MTTGLCQTIQKCQEGDSFTLTVNCFYSAYQFFPLKIAIIRSCVQTLSMSLKIHKLCVCTHLYTNYFLNLNGTAKP